MNRSALFEERMKAIREMYISNLGEHTHMLQQWHEALSQNAPFTEDEKMLFLVHHLSGTGATYGFPAISEEAQKLEQKMRAGEKSSTIILPLLTSLIEKCSNSLALPH